MLAVLLACSLVVGLSSSDAHATVVTPPYMAPANDAVLTSLLEIPTTLPEVGPHAPTVPGFHYPEAWNDAAAVETRAGMASRALPTMGTALARVSLVATAGYVGWKIGSAIYLKFLAPAAFTGPLVTGGTWGFTGTDNFSPQSSNFRSYACPGSECWILKVNSPTWTSGEQRLPSASMPDWTDTGSLDEQVEYLRDHAGDIATAAKGNLITNLNTTGSGPGGCKTDANWGVGSTSGGCQRIITLTEGEFHSRLQVQPSTATEYNALPAGQKVTSSAYTHPTYTSGDRAAARTALGDPAVARNPAGQPIDASGNVLTEGQVGAQNDLNCRIDSSYCAGGTNDPTREGGPLEATKVVAPDCAGLTWVECRDAFEAAGFEVTPTRVILDFDGAVLTKPADAVVTQSVGAGALVRPDTAVTITTNPAPASMPLAIPAPNPGETATAYRARLEGLGVLGAVSVDVLSDEATDPAFGPDAVVRTNPRSGTRVMPGTDVTVVANPHTAPDPAPSWLPFTPPTIPAINLTPLSHAIGCNTFPFGIPCWTYSVVSSWVMDPVAPEFCMPFPFADPDPCIDMSIWDDAMPPLRAMLLLMSFIGLGWLFMRAALGFGGGGGDED